MVIILANAGGFQGDRLAWQLTDAVLNIPELPVAPCEIEAAHLVRLSGTYRDDGDRAVMVSEHEGILHITSGQSLDHDLIPIGRYHFRCFTRWGNVDVTFTEVDGQGIPQRLTAHYPFYWFAAWRS